MEEITIDLKDLFQVVMANKKKIAAITAAFMIAGGAYLCIASPVYQSTSLLRIKQDKGLGDSLMSKVSGGNTLDDKQRMMTDAEILKSRNVVLPVIEKTEERDDDGKLPDYEGYVKSHIVTKPYKDTEILEVDVTGKTPEQAQEANNLIVQGFMNRLTELSHDEQKRTREFLEQRLGASKDELSKAEDKLQQYQAANKMYSTDDQMKQLTDKLNIVDKAKAENQLNLETAQAGLSSVNEQLSSAGVSIADSPAIQQYKTQLAQLEATKASYVGKYTDEHPKMQEINNQINSTRDSLNQEISKIVAQQAPSSNSRPATASSRAYWPINSRMKRPSPSLRARRRPWTRWMPRTTLSSRRCRKKNRASSASSAMPTCPMKSTSCWPNAWKKPRSPKSWCRTKSRSSMRLRCRKNRLNLGKC
ncbi:GumC family protein [Megasphaera sp.]|uniref:GumC family protein n=1 Tax=Megasphaera sp. TaxID=2023260 RepID=UPI003520152C